MGVIFKVLAALMLAFIWVVYLRKVSIFSKVKWLQVLFPLIVGGLTTMLVFEFDLPDLSSKINPKHELLHKFVNQVYTIALLEELCKFIGFFFVAIVLLTLSSILKRKSLIEEPNLIVYASLVALGFATIENYIYFQRHGISIVYMRGMMNTVSHIVTTSIIAGFMVTGYRRSVGRAIWYTFIGLIVATMVHGISNFFLTLEINFYLAITIVLIIFSVQIEIWARLLNNFLNFSRRIYSKKCFDRNTLQKFLFVAFFTAGIVHLAGLVYEEGWRTGITNNLTLLAEELIITIILVVRITRFTIIPRYWQKIWPVLPISIRRGKFQRSIIPTSPRFFLRIKGDEFNEYPFTSRIDETVKLRALPKGIDFDMEVNVKMLEKKFIGPKKELYYLCEIIDFHTIHPQYNSRYVLIRPKNYGTRYYKKTPIVGLIALKGFVNLDDIGPKDCKFISWMLMKKEGERTSSQRMLEMLQ